MPRCLIVVCLAIASTVVFSQDDLSRQLVEMLELAESKSLAIDKFQRITELETRIVAAIQTDDDVEIVRASARQELAREDSAHTGFYHLTRILFVKDADAAKTFQTFAETEDANPALLCKLINKLGVEFRKDWRVSGSPVKVTGLSDKQIAKILETMFERQNLKVGLDAIDLLTGYGWDEAPAKPVNKKRGLELLSKLIRKANRPDIFKAAMERKLHFEKERLP